MKVFASSLLLLVTTSIAAAVDAEVSLPFPIELKSPQDFDRYAFDLDGDVEALKEAMASGEIQVTVMETDSDNENEITPETTIGDLMAAQEESKILKENLHTPPLYDAEESLDAVVELAPPTTPVMMSRTSTLTARTSSSTPKTSNPKTLGRETLIPAPHYGYCWKLPGFGFANNAVLSVYGFFFHGQYFHFKLSCREKCCARQWSCNHRTCKLRCQKYTIVVWSTHRYCCRIEGRIVNPFPTGPCYDDVLCYA